MSLMYGLETPDDFRLGDQEPSDEARENFYERQSGKVRMKKGALKRFLSLPNDALHRVSPSFL
jgi:hypothetical protein